MSRTVTSPAQARPDFPQGMSCVDTSRNPRIPMLMELVGALSRATDPHEVLRTFTAGTLRLYGPMGYISLSTRGLAPGEYRITRQLRGFDPESMATGNTWNDSAKLPIHRGGLLGGIIRSAYPELIHRLDVRGDPVLGDWLAGFGSLLAIPLFDGGEPRNWGIMLRPEPEGFSEQDLEEWILRSNLVGGAVRNTLMSRELRRAHDAIQREVDSIAAIQRALLPESMPRIRGVAVAASYETFDRAGGDYYDFLPIREPSSGAGGAGHMTSHDGQWGVVIADASGHGPSAAVVMAMVHAVLHASPEGWRSPARALEHLNLHLHAKRIESSFVTAFFACYDPLTHRLTYARAGHNPPLLMQPREGSWEMTKLDAAGGLPLGVVDLVEYDEAAITLAPGQTLVLYTDGVTEAASPSREPFGLAGIERSLTTCSGDPDCVISHITGGLREHEAGVQPSDDQTVVVMKVLPTA